MQDPFPISSHEAIRLDRDLVYEGRAMISNRDIREDPVFATDTKVTIDRELDRLLLSVRKEVLSHKALAKTVEVPFEHRFETPETSQAIRPRERNHVLALLIGALGVVAILSSSWIMTIMSLVLLAAWVWSVQPYEIATPGEIHDFSGVAKIDIEHKVAFPENRTQYPESLGRQVQIWSTRPMGAHLRP